MGEERGQLRADRGTDKFHSAVLELFDKCEVISSCFLTQLGDSSSAKYISQ